MIEAPRLLKDLKTLLKALESDVRERLDADAELQARLREEWKAAQEAGRTARPEADWLDEEITQSAAHWILACVFLRFIEDNGLVERPWLAGPSGRLALARDRHQAYFRAHPHFSDREYLIACFCEAAALPGVSALYDERHNPLWRLEVSGDGALALRTFFQRLNPDSGVLDHDFTDPDHGTRFLGDLYQDLSEAAKKRYALLQTPEFVERFILDRTLTPAIDAFGAREVRLIDPACGSGHFLLDAFHRLFDLRVRSDMDSAMPGIAQAALDQVAGVDINPFAVAIARFRLLAAALKVCGIGKLKHAPDFKIHVAIGDSLIHGRRFDRLDLGGAAFHSRSAGLRHATHEEDLAALDRILGQQYHVVVGNPPYITPKDPALNLAYRERYAACHRQYALAVPFIERFFNLALANGERAGFVGMIVANSFMKREFGKKLIEDFFPKIDLTHVLDTAGAYIPGHGTPTTILFGRNREPVAGEVRTVMGIKGEPATPPDPAKGEVWTAILAQIDHAGSESAYISVADTPRTTFAWHPWSIGGGGAVELKEAVEDQASFLLETLVWKRPYIVWIGERQVSRETVELGRTTHTGEDNAFYMPSSYIRRWSLFEFSVPLIIGEDVRDWTLTNVFETVFPYDKSTAKVAEMNEQLTKHFWSNRSVLRKRRNYGNYIEDRGLRWYAHSMFFEQRFLLPLSITFAFVATHNHFVLDRGGKVFNRSAPVIKLPPGSTEDDHLALLGLLNSSTACFWLQQVCHNKGGPGGGSSKDEKWHDFYEFTAAALLKFPLVEPYPLDLASTLDDLGRSLSETLPKAALGRGIPTRADLDHARERALSIRRQMIAWQEELDWRCYRLYGLIEAELEHPEPPEIALGERAFEIVMARRMAAGTVETKWFSWLGITPRSDYPQSWPSSYRDAVERRIALIESDPYLRLLETTNCKRRWEAKPWEELEKEALKDWLLDRLEEARYWGGAPVIRSVNQIADTARTDADFMAVAALYTGRPDFTVSRLVAELVEPESVPFLPVLRYSADGLRKRTVWEKTWDLQRREDAGEDVGDILVPPKYKQKDFQKSDFWRLRGGLDVPKERFISYPGCARDADGSLPLAWAGYDHRRQGEALWTYYTDRKDREGWQRARLEPLLAGVADLLPWLKQWHNDLDPTTGVRFGDFIADVLAEETRGFGLTLDQLAAWSPPAAARNRRGRRRAAPADQPADPGA